MKAKSIAIVLVSFGALAAVPALSAHPGGHYGHDLAGGLIHPFTGVDHLVAMTAAGIWAARAACKRLLLLIFAATFLAGLALGHIYGGTVALEQMVAASVLAIGLLVLAAKRLSREAGLTLLGVFAALHGWAHGAEIPTSEPIIQYAAGALTASVALITTGSCIGQLWATSPGRFRMIGLCTTAAGLVLLVGR